ncbi:ArnT family glycosyltransferase [Neolewinella antarctica]|uniref:Glycosyltransferase RgtA/B/C/D-like domain-containing protein n=1 Tax=Neolewinella antarctica TaxID=442734 RepID=A0ABX0XBA3_9BACT|nr:glycosyltransferase family 39 protein [Neolewinella antarctica]NJC26487.1 hypothetical protein [Neolewinella antarctica]
MPTKSISPYWFLATWLLVNFVQAAASPLDPDETYYWMYASQLDWGYYDHPPAVALLISLGKDWLPGSLGLRFGHVLAAGLTMVGLWYLLERPRGKLLWLAAGLAFAQPLLNVYGFIATPDGPLLLFTVLYLLAYRRFLEAPSLANGAIWGLTMAGALYSKYHGVMLIFFSVLPHVFWLIRQPGAWVAALGGAALYFPHLYWQYTNDFPSFRYHLQGRNDAYELRFTVEYVLNQLGIFSPFLFWYYVKTFWQDNGRSDRFVVANRCLVAGFLGFFLCLTIKGHAEAHWTALVSIPLIYLTYRATRDRFPEWEKGIWRMAVVTIGILCVARLLLLAPREWLPFDKPFDHQPWTERLAAEADGLPVMVENSYRLSSLYNFYTGQPAWTMTNVDYRRNQYDLWYGDSLFHGREVLVMGQSNWRVPTGEPFRTAKGSMLLKRVKNFQVLKGIKLEVTGLSDTLATGTDVNIAATGFLPLNTGVRAVDFTTAQAPTIYATVYPSDNTRALHFVAQPRVPGMLEGEQTYLYRGPLKLPTNLPIGPAKIEFGLAYPGMPPLMGMSPTYEVVLEN